MEEMSVAFHTFNRDVSGDEIDGARPLMSGEPEQAVSKKKNLATHTSVEEARTSVEKRESCRLSGK